MEISQETPTVLLVDNGSLRPEATLQLRVIAQKLADSIDHDVAPVSLSHADNIPPKLLNKRPAHTFKAFLQKSLDAGQRDFIVLPLFFGVSKAVSQLIPEIINALQKTYTDINVSLADVIFPLPDGEPLLSDILFENIQNTAKEHQLALQNIVLVDHGSPSPKVTAVRNHLTKSIKSCLPAKSSISQAAMERRKEKEYDFNGELLENWLRQKAQSGETQAIVALLFFLPGKHAGKGGDIKTICDRVMKDFPGFKIAITELIGAHPKLLDILQSRYQTVLDNKQ